MDGKLEFQTQLSKIYIWYENYKTYILYIKDYLQLGILTGQSPSGKFGGNVIVNLKTPPLYIP